MPAETLPAWATKRMERKKNDSEGRIVDAGVIESGTVILEGPAKDRAVSHGGLFSGLESLMEFSLLCS